MEFFKNVGEGVKVIGKKVAKPAIGLAVAGVTTVALAMIGKHSKKTTEPDIEDETEETEETEGTEEEEDESDESEEA